MSRGHAAAPASHNGTTETATFDAASRLTGLAQDLSGSSYDQTLTLGCNAATQIVSRQNSNTNYQWSPLSAGTTNYADNGLYGSIQAPLLAAELKTRMGFMSQRQFEGFDKNLPPSTLLFTIRIW